MLIDQLIMVLVAMVFSLPLLAFGNLEILGNSTLEKTSILFIWSIYFNKDIYLGRSPGKTRLGLQVVNAKINTVANPFRCLIRNLFIVLWPIEVIVTFFSPKRRIGDFIAGTKVQEYDAKQSSEKLPVFSMVCSVLISWAVIIFVMEYFWVYFG